MMKKNVLREKEKKKGIISKTGLRKYLTSMDINPVRISNEAYAEFATLMNNWIKDRYNTAVVRMNARGGKTLSAHDVYRSTT